MTSIQLILKELDHLDINELELIIKEIRKKINTKEQLKSVLSDFRGKGKGIWKIDAQQYIDEQRDNDRV